MVDLYGFDIKDIKGMQKFADEHFGELGGITAVSVLLQKHAVKIFSFNSQCRIDNIWGLIKLYYRVYGVSANNTDKAYNQEVTNEYRNKATRRKSCY